MSSGSPRLAPGRKDFHVPIARSVLFATGLFIALLLAGAGYIASTISWDRSVVIEGGPQEGFFYHTGDDLAQELQSQGVDVELTYRNDTLNIVEDVQDPDNPVNVGFIAQEIDAEDYPDVSSLGSVVLEPLLLFARAGESESLSLEDLDGRSVWMQVEGSGFDQLAAQVFDLYDLDIEPHYGTLAEGIESVRQGETDVVGVLFPVNTPIVKELATDPALSLVNMPTAEALAIDIGYVQSMTIPPGLLDIASPVPSSSLSTVGLPVTVVARNDLPAAIALDIASRLDEQFGSGANGAQGSTFPNFSDSQLPPHPVVEEFYRSGAPWHYQVLPGWLAEVFGRLVLLSSVAFLLATIYKVLYPDIYGLWTKVLAPRQRRAVLDRVEKLQAEGGQVPTALARQVEAWNSEMTQDRLDRERIVTLSASLSAPQHGHDSGVDDSGVDDSPVSDRDDPGRAR